MCARFIVLRASLDSRQLLACCLDSCDSGSACITPGAQSGVPTGCVRTRSDSQGITSIGDALEAQANSKSSGRKLSEGQEVVEGLTLSVALIGESRQSFGAKQVIPACLLSPLLASWWSL